MHVLVMGLVVTVNTCGDIFMLSAMTLHTGHFAVLGLQGCQSSCLVLMASCTELERNRIAKGYVERTMGLMAFQTIIQSHCRRMSFMAVETGLILSLFQAVLRMTCIAVLLGMGTGICRQLVNLFLMAACAGGPGIIGGCKINQQRMVRIMADPALLNRKMGIVISGMAAGAFRDRLGARRRMLFMALHAGEFFMRLSISININYDRIMTFDAVFVGERYRLEITGLSGRLNNFFNIFNSGFRFCGRFGDRFSRGSLNGFNDLNSSGINCVNGAACHEDKTSDTQ